jgi:4a-hydroxytetrahydrobiopterin dehydratase
MTDLPADDAVADALKRLPQWRREGPALLRTVQLATFTQAIAVVNRVAEIAENDNHHPDIDIRWRTVTFRCSTHSAAGITALDLSLAAEIDTVVEQIAAQPN